MTVVALVVAGLIIGALARWVVPGPDPMPIWLTAAIGMVGSLVGVGLGYAVGGGSWIKGFAIGAAALLVVAYRRIVQKRPLTGPGAQQFPTRGFGVAKARRKLGLDAGTQQQPPTVGEQTASTLQKLKDLRDAGLLTDEEYEAKRIQALEPDPGASEWAPILQKVGLRRPRPEKSSD